MGLSTGSQQEKNETNVCYHRCHDSEHNLLRCFSWIVTQKSWNLALHSKRLAQCLQILPVCYNNDDTQNRIAHQITNFSVSWSLNAMTYPSQSSKGLLSVDVDGVCATWCFLVLLSPANLHSHTSHILFTVTEYHWFNDLVTLTSLDGSTWYKC